MQDTTEIPSFIDKVIPTLLDLALNEVSDCLKKKSKYWLYFLTQVPTTVYEKIRDKVVPDIYLSAKADGVYQIKKLLKEGCSKEAYRFAEVWIRVLEKSSVADKVALVIRNSESSKERPLGCTKDFELPPNLFHCMSNTELTFTVEGRVFKITANHPNMFLATVVEEPVERYVPTITEKHVEEIRKTPKDKIREKLEEYIKIPEEFKTIRTRPPHHVVIHKMDLPTPGDALYILVFNSNPEKHTIIYTAMTSLKDIMLLDALYHDQDLFQLWYK